MDNQLSYFKNIRHFIFDIDGVLTDGGLIVHHDGVLLRSMYIKDGYALQLAIKKGYSVTIISGAKGDCLEKRFLGLGIDNVYLGIENKIELLPTLLKKHQLNLSQTLYMGDDMPDLEMMKQVALPTCPLDACEEIQQVSKYISPYGGGRGCVRDVVEKVLKLNSDWH
ncbi:MAG TPA: HAD hydrolase family protein [Chitinophagaceae bacterium]|nr:HAD hydrolase family protein [Chitinophagaceae bacterium]